MKKYIFLTFVSLVCFTSWVFGKTTNADDKQTDLLVLEEAVQQTDASITEWSLYARERLSISTEKGFTELVENMQQKYQHAKWSSKKKERPNEVFSNHTIIFWYRKGDLDFIHT
ncbi:hypothetical protein [Bacillus coahuilensis]|uniref:hypothetical protein n=1 Tax=Bacillus coahuilensis TaxID=408580 RepID=UPI0001851486|nr:hypothetical protein [Bacillus coahuilensis]